MSSGERKRMERLKGKFDNFYRGKRRKREHERWSESEEEKITYLFKEGKSIKDIANEVGRTPAAIVMRLEKLGFSVKI